MKDEKNLTPYSDEYTNPNIYLAEEDDILDAGYLFRLDSYQELSLTGFIALYYPIVGRQQQDE